MYSIPTYTGSAALLDALNRAYPIRVTEIHLHREMIGWVYIAQGSGRKYVLKLFRPFHAANALRSTAILQYLSQRGFPVVPIISTCSGEPSITITGPHGESVAVLYDYIEGVEPDIGSALQAVGRQTGLLHRLMEAYPGPLPRPGRAFYVDRCIAMLRALEYDPARVSELETFGLECWQRLERLPPGFCHGDLHSGNMRQTADGRCVLFDFDAAALATPVIDVATLCNASDFNRYPTPADWDTTACAFERFYTGYALERTLTAAETAAIFDFIPIRHYELIATITECHGLPSLSPAFLDQQHEWMTRWQTLQTRPHS